MIGIDEAGRGCVVGPLVMCGLQGDEKELWELGVKDSKLLSKKKREELAVVLKEKFVYEVEVIDHRQINTYMSAGVNLNMIEVLGTAAIIKAMKTTSVVLDCPSVNIQAYVDSLKKKVGDVDIRAEFKADLHYAQVAAASIIAKVERDALVDALAAKHNVVIGSGYLSDQKTVDFMQKHWKLDVFRTHWKPYQEILNKNEQQKLF